MREYLELKKLYEKNIDSLKEKYEEDLKKLNNNRPIIDDALINVIFKFINKEEILKNLLFDKITYQCKETYETKDPNYYDSNNSIESTHIYKLGMPYWETKYNSFILNCVNATMLTKILQDDTKFHLSTNEDVCYIEFRTIYHQHNQNNGYKIEYSKEDFHFQAVGRIKINRLLDFFIEINMEK